LIEGIKNTFKLNNKYSFSRILVINLKFQERKNNKKEKRKKTKGTS